MKPFPIYYEEHHQFFCKACNPVYRALKQLSRKGIFLLQDKVYQQKTNLDLWGQLDDLVNNMLFPVKFVHIKGHTGEDNGNNIADILANLVSQKL